MKDLTAIALQVQCDSLVAQIQAEGLKEYAANWLKGKTVVRDSGSGKFASKGSNQLTDSQKALVEEYIPRVKGIAILPRSVYGPRLVKQLERLAAADKDLKGLRDQATGLSVLANELGKTEGNKAYAKSMQGMVDNGLKELQKQTAKAQQKRDAINQEVQYVVTFAAIAGAIGATAKLVGKRIFLDPYVTSYKAGFAVGTTIKKIGKAEKAIEQKVQKTAESSREKNKENIEEIAKRYQKQWQTDKATWDSNSGTKGLGEEIANNLMPNIKDSSVAAAKSQGTLSEFVEQAMLPLSQPNLDLGFVLYLLSQSDFRAALMSQLVEVVTDE